MLLLTFTFFKATIKKKIGGITMNIATVLRYVEFPEKFWEYRYYICSDYKIMAEKLGFGMCAVMNEDCLEDICRHCDGLIIPGSATDIDPKYYGGDPLEKQPVVDEYALDEKLIKYFYDHNKPIFGVCGGFQELNVFFGGSIKRIADSDKHKNYEKWRHEINITEGSFVYDVFNTTRTEVNCFHNWELDRLAPQFDVVARTDDGVAEAIEWKEKNIFATQWHPERSFHDSWDNSVEMKFFENFINRCKECAGK